VDTVLIVRRRNSVSATSKRVWTSCFIVMHETICCGLFNDASTAYAVERQWLTTRARTYSRTSSGVKITWNSMFNNTRAGRVKWLVPSCAPKPFASTNEGGWGRRLGNCILSTVLVVATKLSAFCIPSVVEWWWGVMSWKECDVCPGQF
jgi:hypothetical protein